MKKVLLCLVCFLVVATIGNIPIKADETEKDIHLFVVVPDDDEETDGNDGPAEQGYEPPHPNQFSVSLSDKTVVVYSQNMNTTSVIIRDSDQQAVWSRSFVGRAEKEITESGIYTIEILNSNLKLKGIFDIQDQASSSNYVTVFDTGGRCVYTDSVEEINSIPNFFERLQNLPNGCYMVSLHSVKKTVTMKICR
ncbi:MAG: hypothetical protein IJ756_10135 [Paludibacteraceae bacterium]|nr:hypothetical protein [Paludibacteraceae bacterium]MBR1787500.1 hypothetical protein [Paludibacteraceae bacterium]